MTRRQSFRPRGGASETIDVGAAIRQAMADLGTARHRPNAPGPTLEKTPAELYLVGEGAGVARSLGLPVVRSDLLPYGTVYALRDPITGIRRLIVGTHRDPQERRLELARREARAIVYVGLWEWVTPELRNEQLNRVRNERLLDELADDTVAASWRA